MSRGQFIALWHEKSRPAHTPEQAEQGFRYLVLTGDQADSAFDLFESEARPKFPSAKMQYRHGTTLESSKFTLTARPFETTDLPVH